MTHRQTAHDPHSRRHFLRTGIGAVAAAPLLALSQQAWAAAPARALALDHLHTGEQIELVYARGGDYLPQALGQLDHFLRDHYSGAVGHMDPALHDLLHRLRLVLATDKPFQVISGYRSPVTNAHLKATRGGGVAKRSLHMEGRAIDVRVAGVSVSDLRDAALLLQAGGVGAYPKDGFVHVDTGRVRRWGA